MGPIVQTTTNRLTMKQWTIVAAAVTVTFPAGPIVQAATAIGVAGGCYVSNAMGHPPPAD